MIKKFTNRHVMNVDDIRSIQLKSAPDIQFVQTIDMPTILFLRFSKSFVVYLHFWNYFEFALNQENELRSKLSVWGLIRSQIAKMIWVISIADQSWTCNFVNTIFTIIESDTKNNMKVDILIFNSTLYFRKRFFDKFARILTSFTWKHLQMSDAAMTQVW